MLVVVDVLHRIEALPGQARYTLTFRRADGGEQSTTVQVQDGTLVVAEASLPAGWSAGSPSALALAEAVLAFDRSRAVAPAARQLQDVPGGWDVGLGNVVVSGRGVPTCTAHGELAETATGQWECPECGARALFAG
jgi:hypothetical protein